MLTAEKKYVLDHQLNQLSALKQGLGSELSKCKNVVKGTYDFAVEGGLVAGAKTLLDDDGNPIVIPAKAIVTFCLIDILTGMTSTGGTGTIALTLESAGDLLAAVDADTLSGRVAGIPVGSAATSIKTTVDRTLVANVAVNPLLTGKFNVFLEYVLSN